MFGAGGRSGLDYSMYSYYKLESLHTKLLKQEKGHYLYEIPKNNKLDEILFKIRGKLLSVSDFK